MWAQRILGFLLATISLCLALTAQAQTVVNFQDQVAIDNTWNCSTGWNKTGNTYTCTSGGVSFADMTLVSSNPLTIVSQAAMSLHNMTVGADNRAIDLESTYGGISTTGTNQIYGDLQSGSGAIDLTTTSVSGDVVTNGTLTLTQSTVSGGVEGNNGITLTDSQISGNVTANSGPIDIDGGRISGFISSNCCTITALDANLSGGITSGSDTVSITGGTVSGNISSSGGTGVVMSDVTMPSGSITTTNVPISIDYSQIGTESSSVSVTTNHEISVSDSLIWGDLEANSGYQSLSIDSFSSVYGTCEPDPANGSCQAEPDASALTCSPYHGQGTINELMRKGNSRHLEIKVLNASIPASVYTQWEVRVCKSGLCTGWLTVADAVDSFPWFYFSGDQLPGNGDNNVIDLSGGMDVLLRDSNQAVIDYVRVGTTHFQSPETCYPAYAWRMSTSNTSLVARQPDGTGKWGNSGPGSSYNEFPPSEGESNDDIDTPDGQPAVNINISNLNIAKGDDANFVITLGDSRPYTITVDYVTADGEATANADYLPTSGKVSFAPGETEKTVTVTTLPDGPAPLDSLFYLVLSNPNPGVLLNHFASATFIAEAEPDEVVHHIAISHGGTALTCASADVKVRACADESCSELFEASPVSLTLAPSAGWSAGQSISFTGETDISLTRTTETTVTLGASSIDPAPEATPTVRCNGVEDGSGCDLSFLNTGLLLTDATGTRIDLSTQVAGVDFIPGDLYLSAVETNTETGACQAAIEGTSQLVRWAAVTENPSAPNGHSVELDGTPLVTQTAASPLSFTDYSHAFDSNGRTTAPFTLRYDDVGRIRLIAETDLDVAGNTKTLNLINGGPFTVRPDHLTLDNIRCGAINIGSGRDPSVDPSEHPLFCRAGATFSADVSARNRQGNITPNFGQHSEAVASEVKISHSLVAPNTANNPPLLDNAGDAVSVATADFAQGTLANVELHWAEVGVIQLTASLASWLDWADAGNPISTTSRDVGRFYPDRFSVTWDSGVAPQLAPAQAAGFTYQGQPFGWAFEPILIIEALNTDGNRTRNYGDNGMPGQDFMSLTPQPATAIGTTTTPIYFTKLSTGGGALQTASGSVTSALTNQENYDGLLTLAIANTETWRIEKTVDYESADQFPHPLAMRLTLQPSVFTDQDGVFWPDSGGDPQGITVDIEDGELVYGRLALSGGQAPATSPLRMPLRIERWEAVVPGEPEGRFVVMTTDSGYAHFQHSLGNLFTFDPALASIDYVDSAALAWAVGGVSFTDPLNYEFANGHAEMVIELDLTIPPGNRPPTERVVVSGTADIPIYLRHPWSHGDGALVGPQAVASFGTYEGRPPVLFMLPQGR